MALGRNHFETCGNKLVLSGDLLLIVNIVLQAPFVGDMATSLVEARVVARIDANPFGKGRVCGPDANPLSRGHLCGTDANPFGTSSDCSTDVNQLGTDPICRAYRN